MKLSIFKDRWEMTTPFVTSKEVIRHIDTLTVCLGSEGRCGRGEALGVDYLGETEAIMRAQLENVRSQIEAGVEPDDITSLLPPGGARNALDCALWDLLAKTSGKRVCEMLNTPFEPVTSVFTLSLDSPERMAAQALSHAQFPVLKLKLNHERISESIRAIREARPDATLVIDANGAWSLPLLETVADDLLSAGIAMVEQPLAVGEDSVLEGLDYPVILCADESCQSMADLPQAAQRYRMVNIKLDKCGGLTEAMKMVDWCENNSIELMVGNMLGSSLAMAPAFLVAQYCRYVDLDGPLWQKTDRSVPIRYQGAFMQAPDKALWG